MMFYKDYLAIKPDFNPIMTVEGINRNPDTWLGFYPHKSFVDILRALLDSLDGGQKPIWITGAYGTGKSYASLVLLKLFNDDEARVVEWFEQRKELIPAAVYNGVMERRKDSLFVVYDVNSDGVDAKNQFLMRMQRAITKALQQSGYIIPLRGKLEAIVERIQQDEKYFFEQRDKMQSRLAYLDNSICSASVLAQKLRKENQDAGLVSDVMRVLEARNIYLDFSAEEFIDWVESALDANGLAKLVFIWDEFSSFIMRNSSELKTFEQVAEAAQHGKFYFIPVTHMDITSYWAEGSESAKKANGRFTFKRLEMPNDTALKLAADVFVVKSGAETEWERERDCLWHTIKGVAENYMGAKGSNIEPEDFKGIIPLHPMAAFLLKYLAVAVGSNQRSMFEFLNNQEFHKFINEGGLEVEGKQFLTVDHLWNYFVERDDLGTAQIVQEARAEFVRRQNDLQADEQRVFRAVLLFGLIEQMQSEGHPLLSASVENICRSFEGDGALHGVEAILRDLDQKHCFTIVEGRCERFRDRTDSRDVEEKIKLFENKFNEFILNDTEDVLNKLLQSGNSVTRLDVRATSIFNLTASSISKREAFSKDGNRILLQFVLARDAQEQSRIPEKVRDLATHFHDHRMLFLTIPDVSFCRDDANAWEKFKDYSARKALAKGDKGSERVFEAQLAGIMSAWRQKIQNASNIVVYKTNPYGEPFVETVTWGQLRKDWLTDYSRQVFEAYTDDLSGFNLSAFGPLTHLQAWALAGMEFDRFAKSGPWKTVIATWQKNAITGDDSWFDLHPNHALTNMRDFCKKRQDNTVGSGNTCSIRKLYIDLQRPPFGLLCAPHSAFVLGFVLKTWLTGQRKLQWTDGVTSKPLDAITLAEIIEAVVKDNGAGAIRNEKLICRLSREEKAFIDQSSIIFGYHVITDGTVEAALAAVSARIQQISDGVPLWILPQFIEAQADPQSENMGKVILSICEANVISSKGNTEVRASKVKEVGELLLSTEGLAQALATYMTPIKFEEAFRHYVDITKPELKKAAERLGDVTYNYCAAIKKRFVDTSSWLWKKENAVAVLEEVYGQVLSIEQIRAFAGLTCHMSFEDALEYFRNIVWGENKVSVDYLAKKYPALQRIFDFLKRQNILGEDVAVFKSLLIQNKTDLIDVFFNKDRAIQLDTMQEIFGDRWPSSKADCLELYDAFPNDTSRLDEQTFKAQGRLIIEKFQQKNISTQIKSIWKERTHTESPAQWSQKYSLPAECVLNIDNAKAIVDAIEKPEKMSKDYMCDVYKALQVESAFVDEQKAGKNFVEKAIPGRLRKIEAQTQELSGWVKNELGEDPNTWMADKRFQDVVDRFVKHGYDAQLRKKIEEKVSTLSDAEAKKILLQLVEKNPEAGLSLLEL